MTGMDGIDEEIMQHGRAKIRERLGLIQTKRIDVLRLRRETEHKQELHEMTPEYKSWKWSRERLALMQEDLYVLIDDLKAAAIEHYVRTGECQPLNEVRVDLASGHPRAIYGEEELITGATP